MKEKIMFDELVDDIVNRIDPAGHNTDGLTKHYRLKLSILVNQEVEKRIAEIDQHGRIAVSVIKKKLWSMRFNEDDVKRETDGRRKRFIYGYTEAINDIAQWLTETVSQNTRSRLTNPGNSQKTEGGGE